MAVLKPVPAYRHSHAWLHIPPRADIAESFPAIARGDGLVIDLSLSSEEPAQETMTRLAGRWRELGGGPVLARISTLVGNEEISNDIAAAAVSGVDGIVQTGIRSGADLQHLHSLISVEEALAGIDANSLSIIAEIGDTPLGVLQASSFAGKTGRLAALFYDPSALAEAIGAAVTGSACITGRGLSVLAAAAAGVPAFEYIPASVSQESSHEENARQLRAEGLTGAITRDPAQLPGARRAFSGEN